MLSAFCRGGNCYLCYTGREGRTLHLYFEPGDIGCFHQQWQGSVSLYAVCLGWGSQERNCCVMAPYKLRSSSHQFPSFYLESRVSNAENSCRSCKGVAEKALLSVVLTIKLSMCPPPGLQTTWVGAVGGSLLPRAMKIHHSAQCCFIWMESVLGSIRSFIYQLKFTTLPKAPECRACMELACLWESFFSV